MEHYGTGDKYSTERPDRGDPFGSIFITIIVVPLALVAIGFGIGFHVGKMEAYKEAETAGVGYYKSGPGVPMGEWRMVWKRRGLEQVEK